MHRAAKYLGRRFLVAACCALMGFAGCERQAPPAPAAQPEAQRTQPKPTQPAKPAIEPKDAPKNAESSSAPSGRSGESPSVKPAESAAAATAEDPAPVKPAPIVRKPGGGLLKDDNVLLVTLDTTRADRFGCYGHSGGLTPTTDALASRGTLFEDAYCQVPLTLPSHASIHTGRHPREHGLHNNGRHRLSDAIPTLATVFKQLNRRTGAFVAAFVLDSRFGLDQGFEEYNDDMGAATLEQSPFEREQPANVVTDRALAWLETVKSEPFFAWVHYYDPHDPYAPPPEYEVKAGGPYEGEIAFMDAQMGRLIEFLDKSGLAARTLVVVVADHGESFGENGERGHSMFLHRAVSHIPFIMAHPKAVAAGRRVGATVQTVDIFPTVLDLFGVQAPQGLHGRSLADALGGRDIPSMPAFLESLYCRQTYDWAEQRSIVTRDWRFNSSAKPQLYERKNDPLEVVNVHESQSERTAELRDALETHFKSLTPVASAKVAMGAKERAKLAGLGYVGGNDSGVADFLTPGLAEPHDHLEVIKQVIMAQKLIHENKAALAIPLLEGALQSAPNALIVLSSLGGAYVRASAAHEEKTGAPDRQMIARAEELLKKALIIEPANEGNLIAMGDALVKQDRFDEAIAHYELVARPDVPYAEAFAKLGYALRRAGRVPEAEANYRRALEMDPKLAQVYFDQGVIAADRGRVDESLELYLKAYEHGSRDPALLYNIGVSCFRLGKYEEAVDYYEQALTKRPEYHDAMMNLGITLYKLKRPGEGNALMMKLTQVRSKRVDATYNLSIGLIDNGQKREGLGFLENLLREAPNYAPAINALLAHYLQDGRSRDATRILEAGCVSVPSDPRYPTTLARLLATSRDDEVRNGDEALVHARRASEMTRNGHPEVLQALAAALAETGEFDDAVKTAEKALAVAGSAANAELRQVLEQQLQLYREKKPYRDPKL